MMFGFGLFLGGFIGTLVGIVTCSLMVMAKDADERMGIDE
ncbi:hypothetical protein DEAC_c13980 [Desulfosporosinus acididurans]|uniref:DUF3789 domain-containing protein n=1 Tax=Desulfosporosinus acididurans TaxID=476652 RepID=A0A0J1FTC9_9FIRM|nr:hypothetical protein DEAC_c13980 [Desulfosporosinus acididurans]